MATQPPYPRVGVNFPSSNESYLTIGYYSTVDPSDVIVDKWHLVRADIIDVLKQLPWAVLSVVRGHHIYPEPVFSQVTILGKNPIVLVGAPAESEGSWQTMAEQIYSLCSDAGLEHARILFESTSYPFTVIDRDLFETPDGEIPEDAHLKRIVPMGSGFGPVGETKSSASMGGTIKLQEKDEEPSAFLLSVFHPFIRVLSEQEILHGYRHDPARPIHLKIPSLQDTDHARDWYTRWINKLEGDIKLNAENFENFGDDKFRRRMETFEKIRKGHQEDLQKLHDGINREPGILHYGSGFERATDWSLSSFEDRILQNTCPIIPDIQAALKKQGVNPNDFIRLTEEYENLETVDAFARPEVHELVLMRGRTSGLTLGKVNALESDIIITKSSKLEKELSFGVRAILSGKGGPTVQPGDSGAWFVNMKGEWVGSVVGTHSGLRASIGLAIEAEKIVEDIEAFTGLKVVSPVRSDIPGRGLSI